MVSGPIDVKLSAQTFANTLLLLQKLRAAVGANTDNTTLSSDQFEKAFKALKDIFAEKFIRNQKIVEDMRTLAVDPGAFSREHKKKVREAFRGAFRTWANALLGDFNLLRMVLRHGIFDFSDLRRCAQLLRLERQNACSDDAHLTAPKQTKPDQRLRADAVQARHRVKEAEKYQKWHSEGWQCSRWQAEQVIQLQNGILHQRMVAANQRYGFGKGAEFAKDATLTREEAVALHDFTIQSLQAYFA